MNSTITANNGTIVCSGRSAVEVFRAKTIASALKLYAKTGIKMNRAYTPTAMLAAASDITGTKFKRGQFTQAADALSAWADSQIGTTVNAN
jgi:hypothetical protein